MASLKDLLRETLSSFRSSHRSVPGSEVIYHDTTIGSGIGNVASYVAPSDGIFVMQVETPATDLYIRKNDLDWIGTNYVAGAWPVSYVPCRSGETIQWYTVNTEATSHCHIRFYKYVGA